MSSLAQTGVNHHRHQAVSVNHFFPLKPTNLMTFPTISFKLLPPSHHFRLSYIRLYAAVSTPVSAPSDATRNGTKRVATATKRLKKKVATATIKRLKKDINNELKLNWADSLYGASLHNSNRSDAGNAEPGWVFGIDPDLSGALAVLKPDNSPQVFDNPYLKTLVGTAVRRRLDARLIIQLLQTIDAPIGTTAYLEQSLPLPQDGKQSCWSGGMGYGLWIGILVASGYNVVHVPSMLWKNVFNLAGNGGCKDDSRELASTLFPSMSSLLLRKKDHGRAEALLIAAYGKGIKASRHTSCILEDDIPHNRDLQAPEYCELEAALSFSSSSL